MNVAAGPDKYYIIQNVTWRCILKSLKPILFRSKSLFYILLNKNIWWTYAMHLLSWNLVFFHINGKIWKIKYGN